MFLREKLSTGAVRDCLFALSLLLLPGQIVHDVNVINVEVPVRVFRDDQFIRDLTLDDFEILEDGVAQNIEALYLVKKAEVERKHEVRPFAPDLSRHFYLFFILYEYTPRVRDAVNLFIHKVIVAGDDLTIVTPRTTYRMTDQALLSSPKEKVVDKLTKIIRKDILVADAAYRSALNDIKRLVGGNRIDASQPLGVDYGGGTEYDQEGGAPFLLKYRMDLLRLEQLRSLDQAKLFDFAEYLKGRSGQKHVFLFYQREYVPVLDKKTQSLMENDPIAQAMVNELMELYRREADIDSGRLRTAYADSAITIHFMFLTTRPNDLPADMASEHSEDVYAPFSEMASSTGGLIERSSNLTFLMERASQATESYYVLYYAPTNKDKNGAFRNIQVRIKGKSYRVLHRAGYIADEAPDGANRDGPARKER
jgi:VWFA-related protein